MPQKISVPAGLNVFSSHDAEAEADEMRVAKRRTCNLAASAIHLYSRLAIDG